MRTSKQSGFTLIETIVALVLLGVIGLFGSMYLSQIVKGYIFSADNNAMSQKAMFAVAKLQNDLMFCGTAVGSTSIKAVSFQTQFATAISSGTSTSLTFNRKIYSTDASTTAITLSYSSGKLVYTIGGTAYTLVDSATALSITYSDNNGASQASFSNSTTKIVITFTLRGGNGKSFQCSTTIPLFNNVALST